MSKIKPISVILTDTHLKKDNLILVESIFEQAFQLAIKLNCYKVLHAGDWFTDRVGQNLQTLLCLKRILNRAFELKISVEGISGNHDKTDQNSEDSYLDIFDNYKGFRLHRNSEQPLFLDDYGMTISFLSFFTLSYNERLSNISKKLKLLEYEKNILITHVGVNGVKNNDGSEVTEGIAQSDFKFFDKVLIGHYHDASKIGDNIHYIGSSYQANFGENITDKGFTVLYSDGSLKFFKSKFKKYIKVKLDASDNSSIQNELELHKDSEDNVRFIFQGKKTDIDKINLSKFTDEGIDCKFEVDELNEELFDAETNDFTQLDDKQILKHFFEYCKIQNVDSEKRRLGMKFLKL